MQEQSAQANTLDPRSDTFDVQSYTINAEFLNYQTQKAIDATTRISVVLKESSSKMSLDLLELPVSGVLVNGDVVSFSYSSPKLTIDLPAISVGDTFTVDVSYSGNPSSDAQWGGFYFTGEYAFNLGVGFAADPH
ncbi:MAG TPA: hypothetical protein DCY51_10185, partial [Bacteroidetes bacterium]|nr:hypothetical protein [Bacteroidota bacterium]